MKRMTGRELIIKLIEDDALDANVFVSFSDDEDEDDFRKLYKQGYLDCIDDISKDVDCHMLEEKTISKSVVHQQLVDLYCIKSDELEE